MPPETEQLHWTDINDFSPGIFEGYGLGVSATPAPQGAAQKTNTYRCRTLPGGGLCPGPRKVGSFVLGLSDGAATSPIYMTGFQTFGPVLTLGGSVYQDNAWLAYTYQAGATRKHSLARLNFNKIPFTREVLRTKDATVTSPVYWASTFAISRMSSNLTDPTIPGVPVVCAEYADPTTGKCYFIAIPDPTTPLVFGYRQIIADDLGLGGQILAHQGRVVQLGFRQYGTADPAFATGTFNNEIIGCTDPPNGATFLNAEEVFMPEFPTGYGAWGSISSGELLLIKHKGGGVMVSGDILNPTITRLPGLVSTGPYGTRTASTKAGLLYATRSGIHAWTGGQTSVHISPQLSDIFFSTPVPFFNQQVGIADWLDWAVVTDGWLFDIDKGSWWRLDNPADYPYPIQWVDRSYDGRWLYGCLSQVSSPGGAGENTVMVWDRTVFATNFSWQSQPIPGSINRNINVREIAIVAQGVGTVKITVTAKDNTTQDHTFTINSPSQPERQRFTYGVNGFNIVVRIESDGGATDAPTIFSLGVGTYESLHAQPTRQ